MAASSQAVRRLCRDFQAFSRSPHPNIDAQPSGTDALRWDFLFHDLPGDSPYAGGVYHGYLQFPAEYPMAPPKVYMCTPSGRLAVGQSICLSATAFHPEAWNPAWTAGTLLVGMLSFFLSEDQALGTIRCSDPERRRLAAKSRNFCRDNAALVETFPDLLDNDKAPSHPAAAASSQDEGSATAAASGPAAGSHMDPSRKREAPNGDDLATQLLAQAAPPPEAIAPQCPAASETSTAEAGPEDSSQGECWVCRDEIPGEALIQPCACRGSMGGVHASCINAWIARAATHGHVHPSCPVCRQPYQGCHTVQPHIRLFAADRYQKLRDSALVRVAPRFALQLVCMRCYVGLWVGDPWPGIAWAALVTLLLTLCLLHKALIVVVSLPRGGLQIGPEPQEPARRFLFAGSPSRLRLVVLEMKLSLALLIWWLRGDLPTAGLLPFVVYILPLAKVLAYPSPRRFCRHFACFLAIAIDASVLNIFCYVFGPFFWVFSIFPLIGIYFCVGLRYRQLPDAGLHLMAAAVVLSIISVPAWKELVQAACVWAEAGKLPDAFPAILLDVVVPGRNGTAPEFELTDEAEGDYCSRWNAGIDDAQPPASRVAASAVMAVHMVLMLYCLFDGFFIRRLVWRPGVRQWETVKTAAIVAWLALNVEFLTCVAIGCGVRLPAFLVFLVASFWAALIWALVTMVEYKRWLTAQTWRIAVAP